MKLFDQLNAFKITLIYVLAGFLWIYLTDVLVAFFYIDAVHVQRIVQTTKGFFFVSLSALLIYLLVKRHKTEIERVEKLKIESLQKHLKEKNTLLAEVHHRVKNNLAIISSLLHLQSENAPESAKEITRVNVGRIKSMALIHELLYQSEDFSMIDMKHYLSKLVGMISSIFLKKKDSVIIKCEELDSIELDITIAIPVGIIANEVLTNAYQHAFSNNTTAEGIIMVKLKEIDKKFVLSVEDNGVGFSYHEKKDKGSLGLNLIEGLCAQINASCCYSSTLSGGSSFELVFNLPD